MALFLVQLPASEIYPGVQSEQPLSFGINRNQQTAFSLKDEPYPHPTRPSPLDRRTVLDPREQKLSFGWVLPCQHI